jgi:choline dehydrogenase
VPYTDDINDPSTPLNVCGKFDCTIDLGGRRSSTFKAFLPHALATKRKSHLHICTGAAVSALNMEEDTNQLQVVKGVSFQAATGENRKTYHARARREVILSAGAIATPQILLLRYAPFSQHSLDIYSISVASAPPTRSRNPSRKSCEASGKIW